MHRVHDAAPGGRVPVARAVGPAPGLVGRRTECETLDRLLTEVAAGSSRALVLHGDAGVGKSALLGHVAERALGWRLTWAVGVESEMELAYSGLHQVCAPLMDHVEELPPPQREALRTVFGLSSGPVPDRFLVGLATVSLLALGAEEQPLLCVVDDAQWFDHASAQVLAFVARRLLADRVAVVFAVRPGSRDDLLAGFPSLPVRGLGAADSRALLLRHLHVPLDEAVCDQIVAESHGNPLALIELPRALGARRLAGGFGLTDGPQVAGLIQQGYARRLSLLPPDTRLLVLAAAAEPRGDPVLLQRAAQALAIDMDAVLPAADEGLIHVGGRVEFAHPLVRSAVYGAAGDDDRHRVHRALAQATDAGTDPDRRAWHRARGTAGPDDEVAAELERAAARAQSRAGLAAAAAFLSRATELTADPSTGARLALAAATAHVQAGAFDAAQAMLSRAGEEPVDDLQRARVDLLGAQLSFATNRGGAAAHLLAAAARRLEPLDPDLALATYVDALIAALFAARMSDGVALHELARAARAAPRPPRDEPAPADLLLEALAMLLTEDDTTAFPVSRAALRGLARAPRGTRSRWLWLGTALASDLWDDDSWYELSERYLRLTRDTGALSELPHAVNARATILLACGELPAAAELIDEGLSVQEATGIRTAPYASLVLAALRGRTETAEPVIERAIGESAARGEGWGVSFGHYTHALLCNGLGRHDEALLAARRARDSSQGRTGVNLSLPELIEAAARSGRPELAAEALDQLSGKARASGTDWALGIEARSRALVSDEGAAEERFRAAISHLGRTRVRADLARAHLLYGEWLRGTDRRMDARAQLTVAFELFTGMGVNGFAGRARRELQATGIVVPRQPVVPDAGLTPQEARIARLARDGLSNPEIGAQLFLSARTVEWHLRKVFTKLGITSRRHLRQALPEPGAVSA